MRTVATATTYTFILQEDEWYSATEQQKEAWINQVTREGKEAGALYLALLVKPDDVMSISPNPRQHKVWGHTFETSEEALFREALELARDFKRGHLTRARMAAIAKAVFEQ